MRERERKEEDEQRDARRELGLQDERMKREEIGGGSDWRRR